VKSISSVACNLEFLSSLLIGSLPPRISSLLYLLWIDDLGEFPEEKEECLALFQFHILKEAAVSVQPSYRSMDLLVHSGRSRDRV
jgi:hypothetical protein